MPDTRPTTDTEARVSQRWRIWIDTGGTFTDCVAIDPDGRRLTAKVLSSGALRTTVARVDGDCRVGLHRTEDLPAGLLTGFDLCRLGSDVTVRIARHDPTTGDLDLEGPLPGLETGASVELRSGEEAPLLAARIVTATPRGEPLPPIAMRLATTRGTNALLERRGARVLHLTTSGFEDLIAIGDQTRPDLFALAVKREPPLTDAVVGVRERLAADGSIIESFDESECRDRLREAGVEDFDCASIALLHGHRNPIHETAVEALLLDLGVSHVSRSSRLSPFQGLLQRSVTALTDASLQPVISDYLEAVQESLDHRHSTLHVMTSAGGLVDGANYRAVDSLLSGPAGGVVGAALSGSRAGTDHVIAFDMGGTSTDVSRFDGAYEYVFAHTVGPVRLAAPALAIETVAAGGGSICRVDQGRLAVGPESAGATPGPASYGAGGPLTLTDVNLLLGRLVPQRFPIPVDIGAARRRFDELRTGLGAGTTEDDETMLEGMIHIADERMAEAIRRISVRKGVDPTGYSLVAFGGAGPQHACRVADLLDMAAVILPGDAGLLSAVGLGHGVIERFAGREILEPLTGVEESLPHLLADLEEEAEAALSREGVAQCDFDRPRRIVELRFQGQDATIEIDVPPGTDLAAEFERLYLNLFAYRPENRAIEVVSARVIARSRRPSSITNPQQGTDAVAVEPSARQRCFIDGRWLEIPCFEAADLEAGSRIDGPALIHQAHSSLVVPACWRATGSAGGSVIVRRLRTASSTRRVEPRAVEHELMSHRFSAIAGEMGERLRHTAVSTNIKERQDFSCTLLDPDGRLVVNAPHIPVHLGAMGLCVRSLAANLDLSPGDVVVTNHPAFGGSHLPDVTLVAPVFTDGRVLGFVACRAHHAEIGGVRPGSVPPAATSLAEEGVVISPMKLVEGGRVLWTPLEDRLTTGPWPTRTLEDNKADLRAMLAAIVRGREALEVLAATVGAEHLVEHMTILRRRAAGELRRVWSTMADGIYRSRQELDDGSPIAVTLTVSGDRAVADFAGSATVHPGNLNATPAIVHSALMYVMRLLVATDLPLNEGLLDPIEIRLPGGMLNPPFPDDPRRCPAVVGGNVETSQRLVDALLEALGLAACSQGTMNNVTFGNRRFGYYETVAGGSGATPEHQGADAVHTHMTNTRITDPEVLEHRYPVRLRRFAVRRGSGGPGRLRGGDGVIREYEFLDRLELSILSQHRVVAPYGLGGGGNGSLGRQWLLHADGTRRDLSSIDGCEVHCGDRLVLETPGGGGYGTPG